MSRTRCTSPMARAEHGADRPELEAEMELARRDLARAGGAERGRGQGAPTTLSALVSCPRVLRRSSGHVAEELNGDEIDVGDELARCSSSSWSPTTPCWAPAADQ